MKIIEINRPPPLEISDHFQIFTFYPSAEWFHDNPSDNSWQDLMQNLKCQSADAQLKAKDS